MPRDSTSESGSPSRLIHFALLFHLSRKIFGSVPSWHRESIVVGRTKPTLSSVAQHPSDRAFRDRKQECLSNRGRLEDRSCLRSCRSFDSVASTNRNPSKAVLVERAHVPKGCALCVQTDKGKCKRRVVATCRRMRTSADRSCKAGMSKWEDGPNCRCDWSKLTGNLQIQKMRRLDNGRPRRFRPGARRIRKCRLLADSPCPSQNRTPHTYTEGSVNHIDTQQIPKTALCVHTPVVLGVL